MTDITYRVLDAFPEPAFTTLATQAFSDYVESELLAAVLAEEAAARKHPPSPEVGALRIGAFEDGQLIGWTFAKAEGNQLHMVNSGVSPAGRRQGVYTRLAQLVLEHAAAQGYVSVLSRHTPNNNAVIIAKLKLGFAISGFEYSEVYGPLVRLTYLPGALRRELHQARSEPIRKAASRPA